MKCIFSLVSEPNNERVSCCDTTILNSCYGFYTFNWQHTATAKYESAIVASSSTAAAAVVAAAAELVAINPLNHFIDHRCCWPGTQRNGNYCCRVVTTIQWTIYCLCLFNKWSNDEWQLWRAVENFTFCSVQKTPFEAMQLPKKSIAFENCIWNEHNLWSCYIIYSNEAPEKYSTHLMGMMFLSSFWKISLQKRFRSFILPKQYR